MMARYSADLPHAFGEFTHKGQAVMSRATFLLAVFTWVWMASSAQAQRLDIYPMPDLSKVENLTAHDGSRYVVKVNGRAVPVYATNDQHNRMSIQTAYIAYFSFADMKVDVEVTCGFGVNKAQVRPFSRGIEPAVEGRAITFTMAEPKKVWVQANDDLKFPLFIFADAPIEDPGADAVDHYFGPGVHHIGLDYAIQSNQKVFIAGGAVVEGKFNLPETDRVAFAGRGIICQGQWTGDRKHQHRVFESKRATRLDVSGIIAIDMDSHCFNWDNGGRRVTNLKIVAFNPTTDGVGSIGYGQTVEDPDIVKDCFIVTGDDVLRVDGDVDNVLFEDIAIWHDNNCAMIFGQYVTAGDVTRDITYRDIDVMVSAGKGAVIQTDLQNEGRVENIRFENIRVEQFDRGPGLGLVSLTIDKNTLHFHNRWDKEKQGHLSGITIRNLWAPASPGQLRGHDEQHKIANVRFIDLVIDGRPITALDQTDFKTNAFIENVTFEVTSQTEAHHEPKR